MSELSRTPGSELSGCPVCGARIFTEPSRAGDAPCPQCGHLLWFVVKLVDDSVVLTFLPGLSAGSEGLARVDEVAAAIGSRTRVVVNLAPLRFLSSLFLGMLVALQRRVRAAGGKLRLCGLQSSAREAFQATQLDQVFEIYEDENAALAG